MLFARPTEYAVRALSCLARRKPGQRVGAREISRSEKIPGPFLWKILRLLRKGKVLRSCKGIGGGYELARPAEEITLGAVARLTENTDFRHNCALGRPRCNSRNPCRLHYQWKEIRAEVAGMLEETSLADLAATRRVGKPNRLRA